MSEDVQGASSVEESAQTIKNGAEFVRHWMTALDLASSEEKDWRKGADKAVAVYRTGNGDGKTESADRTFNILHANVETMLPALYNSTPVPDVRRRYLDDDKAGKHVADMLERALSFSIDSYDFDSAIHATLSDLELAGRGTVRVRYVPYMSGEGEEQTVAYHEVPCEPVYWQHFRHGPARQWADVPWVAFELFLTRDQLRELSPKLAEKVRLDCEVGEQKDKGDGNNPIDAFKRARVWEIWDKDSRQVIFIATGYKEGPIKVEADPLGLTGFFPMPRPIYAAETSGTLIPIVPYSVYRDQAEELERVSRRIMALVDALRARGAYDGSMPEMARVAEADDNELIAIENAIAYADNGGLAKAVFWWPIETIVAVLERLYIQRDQIKQAIYEITGIADILRGQTDPGETLGAQQIKAQWGSLRTQRKQAEVQRFIRDIFRIKSEIIATKFDWQTLVSMTGLQLPAQAQKQQAQIMAQQAQAAQKPLPEQIEKMLSLPAAEEVEQLMRDDASRGFRVDVESDSTIRADMTRNQQMMGTFLQGTAQYMQAIGPAVMQGFFPPDIAVEIYSAFARNFRLGKQAEDALDRLADTAKKAAQQAQQPKPDPQAEAEKAKAEALKQKSMLDMKVAQAKHGFDMEKMHGEAARDQQKLALDQQRMEMQAQADAEAL